jgi:hypothetical protein
MSPQDPGEMGHEDPCHEAAWFAARKRLARETMDAAFTKTARELAFDLEQHAGVFSEAAADISENESAESDLQAEADLIETAERLRLISNALEALPETANEKTLFDFAEYVATVLNGKEKTERQSK